MPRALLAWSSAALARSRLGWDRVTVASLPEEQVSTIRNRKARHYATTKYQFDIVMREFASRANERRALGRTGGPLEQAAMAYCFVTPRDAAAA